MRPTRWRRSTHVAVGVAVLLLNELPMRLNLIVAGLLGIVAGTLADVARERWTPR